MMLDYNFFVTEGAEVDVRGWIESGDALDWAERHSDHALLYFEVDVG